MNWIIEYAASVQKSVRKLDPQSQHWIKHYLEERLARLENPRQLGIAMQRTEYRDLWHYRVGDYRVIAKIEDEKIKIMVVRIGHRKDIYR